jgi:hypothetical protein
MLSHEKYEKIKNLYWVLESCWHNLDGTKMTASVYDWVFSPNVKPYPVPNKSMPWRSPTYEECVERQKAYEDNPEEFMKKMKDRSEGHYWMSSDGWAWQDGLHWYVNRAKSEPSLRVG